MTNVQQLVQDVQNLERVLNLGTGALLASGKVNLADAAAVHAAWARIVAALQQAAQQQAAATGAEQTTGDAGSASPAPAAVG